MHNSGFMQPAQKANYRLFIGADNNTGVVDVSTIESIMNASHDGYTLYEGQGHWLGKKEGTVILEVTDDEGKIMATVRKLKTELKQDAIAYIKQPPLNFI